MRKLALVLVTVALSCGSALSSFAAWVAVGNNDWKYQAENGTYVANSWIKHTDSKWYYLGADTMMEKGWFLDAAGKWFFLDANGAMQTGLIHVDGKAYFMNDSGDLFLGDKVVNGKSYNFGLYGTTNGTPYANNQFHSNGAVVAESNTSGGGGGGGSVTIVPPTVTEKAKDTKDKLDKLADPAVATIEVKNPTSTGSASAKVEVTIAPKQEAIDGNIASVQILVKDAVAAVVDSADEETAVTISVGGETLNKSVDEIMDSVNNLAGTWITADKFKDLKSETAKISVVIGGVTVTYNISL